MLVYGMEYFKLLSNSAIVRTLVIVLAIGTLLIGCARQDDSGYAAFDPDQEYTVTMGVYGDLEAAYTEVFNSAEFQALYPNITIEFQSSDFNGHHNRLTTILAANEISNDIEALEVAFIARFVEGDALRDLTAEPFNGQEVVDDVVSFAISNATTTDGKLVGHAGRRCPDGTVLP